MVAHLRLQPSSVYGATSHIVAGCNTSLWSYAPFCLNTTPTPRSRAHANESENVLDRGEERRNKERLSEGQHQGTSFADMGRVLWHRKDPDAQTINDQPAYRV